ncbi:MAG: hypothetical protein ACE5I7_17400 [Candidatus Binatia bacterium]
MKPTHGQVVATCLGFLLLSLSVPQAVRAQQPTGEFLCSGGTADGMACTETEGCPDGVCVIALGICDGGDDDALPCDCSGGTCSADPPCDLDPTLGTCNGGVSAGECCDVAFDCRGGAGCTATQKVCLAGDTEGLACLRDAQCPGSQCAATGRVCVSGGSEGFPCVDDGDCIGGLCQGRPRRPGCIGDCDGDGAVTIDELLVLVNNALGEVEAGVCGAGDANADGLITIDEILTAVNNALNGCPAPTPTATAVSTATPAPTATSTDTPAESATPSPTAAPPATDTPAPTVTPEVSPTQSQPSPTGTAGP